MYGAGNFWLLFIFEHFATVADGIGDTSAVDDKVFATRPSVQNITQKMTGYQDFQFQNLQSFEVEKALQNLNVRKSTGWDDIPPMALKGTVSRYCACTKL